MPARLLEEMFDHGTLVRPSDHSPNLVHLVRAIAAHCGVAGFDGAGPVGELSRLIEPSKSQHLIFVLLDGLGMNIVRQLPEDSFLQRNFRRQINATSPSTTACALTSVATAEYANQHAVAGWFTYLPELNLTIATLPFAERLSGQPLANRGVKPQDVLPCTAIAPKMTLRRPVTLSPNYIAHTPYNLYSRGGTTGIGYESLTDAIDKTIAAATAAADALYMHLYLHDIDTLCHHVGVGHDSVVPLVLGIDAELQRLQEALGSRARIIVSADHGLIDVPRDSQMLLQTGDPMLELLQFPPTGDARMPIFHVKQDRHEAFSQEFRKRLQGRMLLLPTGEAEKMELFGPGTMSETARPRFGDFIGIPIVPATLAFHPPHKPIGELYLAVHAGLSQEEMQVPLCVTQ